MAALPDDPSSSDWADAAALVGPGGSLLLPVVDVLAPPDWEVRMDLPNVQLIGATVLGEPDDEAVMLTADDVEDMLDLVRRTRPGPFERRTIDLGNYLGVRREGRLIAMAGERMHAPGWTEISAVCTAPEARGQGLAGRLTRAVAHGIRRRGETPFLHAEATNATAIRLYESLGFTLRKRVAFRIFGAPTA